MSQNQQLRIGWVGFHMEGIPALRALIDAGHKPVVVLTLKPTALEKRSGRIFYKEIFASDQLDIREIGNVNDPDAQEILRSAQLDVLFVIGWSQILKPETLSLARLGVIGAHASYLPKNRGSAPINWAIINGETSTGNSLMWLDASVDAGDIIDQMPFAIEPYDTCETLYQKVAQTNAAMILRAVQRIAAGERPGVPQAHGNDPLLARRRPEDGLIDWSQPARRVYDFIRALTRPYPGGFSWLNGRKHFVWNAALPGLHSTAAAPGAVLGPCYSPTEAACGQVVQCGDGPIILLEVEEEGGQILRGKNLSEANWKGTQWKPQP
ncbi:MAG TPA: methionyl-tRNA formyltransferase [Methylomirabilota bacterium]|nr:methionyl-tRNA formyltransferase [Methylomirabilota bacterium]